MRGMKHRIARCLFVSALAGLAAPAAAASSVALAWPAALATVPAAPVVALQDEGADPAATERIVVVTGGKAAVRTLADKQAPAVFRPTMGSVLRVAGPAKAAFLPVQAPGGFPVWIHGSLVRTTDETGVLEITANAVNQRPLPSSDLASYPLETRLHAGDRVRVIARNDASKPLAEDWIQVWSSGQSFGWVLASDVADVKADGATMWVDALEKLGARTVTAEERAAKETGEDAPTGGEVPAVRDDGTDAQPTEPQLTSTRIAQARALLDQADAELERLRGLESPDLSGVRATYAQIVEANISSDLTARAASGLTVIDAIEKAKALESDLEAEKARRLESLMKRQRELWEESRKRDPLGGRFDARGVLEIQARAGEEPRYVLRWGPELVCEVRCSSGRYDLDLFASYELGLKGVLDYTDQTALLKERPVLDLARIEVLSRRR